MTFRNHLDFSFINMHTHTHTHTYRIQQEDSVSLPHVTCPPASRAEELAASQIPLVLSSATKVL